MRTTATPWTERIVDELCHSIVDCLNRTAPVVPGPTPYRMLRTTNVRDGFIDAIDTRFVDEDVFRTWTRRQVPRPGDIILTREAPLGEVGMIRPGANVFLGQRLVSYRTNPDVLDNRFLLYYLRSDPGRSQVMSFGMGATVAHMRVPDAKKLMVPVPPIEVQRRIASILGAYDDLIEVNRRRVAVLEEMARGLFEEWFVRFRFPGHETLPIIDTPDGPLPERWRNAIVSDVFSLGRGRSYKSSELAESGGMPFVNLKCILRDGGFKASGLKRYTGDFKQGHVVSRGDIVMAVTDMTQERRIVGRVGRIPLLDEQAAVISMDLVKVQPAPEIDKAYLYCWLRYSDFGPTAARYANGANVLHLSPKAVAELPFVLPSLALAQKFGEVVEPLLELSEVLELTGQRLAASRDLLLPRLISGQLSVDSVERELEEVA